jgi:outer membrane protein
MAVRGRWIGAALAALLVGQAARADTLREAFIRVYTTNPSMTGARAGLRAIDENVPIARASGLPSVDATGSYNEFVKRSALNFTSPARSVGGELSVNVPIYQGGQVRNSVKAAETRVVAGRADLRSTEADLFTQTVAAYMDVIRDQSIVELNAGNVKVLETDLQASRDRFEVGDLTRTDVAQSDARLAGARSQLQSAEAQLDASRQTYLRIVGKFPENLEPPPPLPALPANADDAVDVATENNPALESARQASKAADYDIRSAEGQRLPQLSAFGRCRPRRRYALPIADDGDGGPAGAAADFPGRPARRARATGAGAQEPGARTGDAHRTGCGRRGTHRLFALSGGAGGDRIFRARGFGERTGAGRGARRK